MPYTRTTWVTGDAITATKLNNFETYLQALSDASNSVGNLSHVQTQTVSGAAVDTVTFSSLNGTTDILYFLQAQLLLTGAAGQNRLIHIECNSDTTATNYDRLLTVNTSGTGLTASNSNANDIIAGVNNNTGTNSALLQLLIYARVGNENIATTYGGARRMRLSVEEYLVDTGVLQSKTGALIWKNNADNLTTLKITCRDGVGGTLRTGIAVDSRFTLWKILNKDR